MEESTYRFNKELVLGEIGAWIFAPLVAFITSRLADSTTVISISAVIGSILGGVIFWLSTRIYHYKQREGFKPSRLASDIMYFTPIAFLLALSVYNPTVYSVSHYLLNRGDRVVFSVIASQLIGFSLFLIGINTYRMILHRVSRKRL